MKIIKMSVDTFWRAKYGYRDRLRMRQRYIRQEFLSRVVRSMTTLVLVRREIHSGVPAFMQKRFRRRLPASRKPSIHRRFRLRRRSG